MGACEALGSPGLSECLPPVVTPPPVPCGGLLVGIHLGMRNANFPLFLDTLHKMYLRGRPCPLVLLLDPDNIAASQIRAVSPSTLIVSRVYPGGGSNLTMTAAQYFGQYVDGDVERRQIYYHQINNENNDASPQAIQWWIEQAKWTMAHGNYRIVIPTWPTGNPDYNVYSQPHIWELFRFCAQYGFPIALHEYYRNDQDWELFRFADHCYPLLPPDVKAHMPLIMHTEWGQQGLRDMPRTGLVSLLRTYQARLAALPFRAITATWTWGDTGDNPPPAENLTGDNYVTMGDVFLEI